MIDLRDVPERERHLYEALERIVLHDHDYCPIPRWRRGECRERCFDAVQLEAISALRTYAREREAA